MNKWVRGQALTLAGAAAIASVYVGWSGSAAIHAARSPLPAFAGAVAPAPEAVALVSAAVPRAPLFAFCGDADCPAGVQGAGDGCDTCLAATDLTPVEVRFAAFDESSPLSADVGLGAMPSLDGGLSGMAFSGLDPGAAAAPAPEISTAAMVALGVVFLTTRRRKRWAAWKAPWKAAAIPSVC